jgi:heterodisulfide reductase subunit A-like polyferredoxin
VIGGGIIGNSVAYHLGQMGMKDVVLLEQQQITAGTTWHAAGLMVTFGSMNETSTDMRKYTKKLYSELEAETGQATGFKPVGKTTDYTCDMVVSSMQMPCIPQVSLSWRQTPTDWKSIAESPRSIASTASMCTKFLLKKFRSCSLCAVSCYPTFVVWGCRSITDYELCTGVDDILAGFYVKDDGRVNPVDATMALSKGRLTVF